jgi:hypothetical protein
MSNITLPRATVQQALEALILADSRDGMYTYAKEIAAFRDALADHYCDTHCTWLNHAEGCDRAEPVADALIRKYIAALVANSPDEAANATKAMVDYVYTAPQPRHDDEALLRRALDRLDTARYNEPDPEVRQHYEETIIAIKERLNDTN